MPPSCALLGGFAIGARVALLWQHYGNAWQSPAVIRQAHRTPHACRTRTLRMPTKTPLAGDKIDAPAACAVPFCPYCGGVVTRTRNVSEYMLVLALCLVSICIQAYPVTSNRHHRSSGDCLEGKRENYQVCSVQYCVQQLCTVNCTHI